MRGTILEFDARSHRGSIAGYDGNKYDFVMLDWRNPIAPTVGMLVEFSPEANHALAIDLVAYAPAPKSKWLRFLFSAEGRISRSEYWLRYMLPLFGIMFAAGILDGILFSASTDSKVPPSVFRSFAYLFFLVPMFAVPAKRLHDQGYSGWWTAYSNLLGPVPVLAVAAYWYYSTRMRAEGGGVVSPEPLSPFVVAVLTIAGAAIAFWWLHLAINIMFLRGQSGENKYGPSPLPPLDNPPSTDRGKIISFAVSGFIVVVGSLAILISVLRSEPASTQPPQTALVMPEQPTPVESERPAAPQVDDAMIKQRADAGFREMMSLPLIGLLIREVPAARSQIETAIDQYARANDPQTSKVALTRAREVVASLRKEHVPVALKRAPDIDIVRIWRAQGSVAEYLLQTDLGRCREYSEYGIRDINSLDQRGRVLFTEALKTTEVAFLSGRISNTEYPVFHADEAALLFAEFGFTSADFDVLADTAKHTDHEVCATMNKMYAGVLSLPEDKAVQLMRTILVDQ